MLGIDCRGRFSSVMVSGYNKEFIKKTLELCNVRQADHSLPVKRLLIPLMTTGLCSEDA